MNHQLVTSDDRTITELRTPQLKFNHLKQVKRTKSLHNKSMKGHDDQNNLQELIRKNKTKKMTKNFIKKLTRIVPSTEVPENQEFQSQNIQQNFFSYLQSYFKKNEGIKIPAIILMIWNIIKIVNFTILMFIITVVIGFPENRQNQIFNLFKLISLFLNIGQIVLNFFYQKNERGREMTKLNQICLHYIHNGFFTDLIGLFLLLSDIIINKPATAFMCLFLFWKLFKNVGQLSKYEYIYIVKNSQELYYKMIKVFITNFVIGHILSILLNFMTNLDSTNNWYIKNGLVNTHWIQRYAWGYYWGTNIMLTVGFGDLSAANYKQALILIFIQTFSCITLAYNISTVGSILSELQNTENERQKLLKTFKHMSIQNQLSSELQIRIVNFIQESFQIRQAFLYDQYDELMDKLPNNLKSQYRKQANKVLFENVPFLNLLSKKSLLNLAEKVHRKVAHPEQIIAKRGEMIDFMILEKGQIEFTCKNSYGNLNGKSVYTLKSKDKSKLISLGFIKNDKFNFTLKSLDYSLIYYLSREEFEQCLKENAFDYQLWCSTKDKHGYYLDENQIHPCKLCGKEEKHDPYNCPKLHYIPIKQHIIHKFINKTMKIKNRRTKFLRNKKHLKVLKIGGNLKKQNKQFIKETYGTQYIEETEKYKKMFDKIKEVIVRTKTKKSIKNCNDFKEDDRYLSSLHECHFYSKKDLGKPNFWNIECDTGYSFSHYKRKNNPDELDIGFLPHNEFFQI